MSLESDIAILRNVPLFEGLASDQLRLLAFGAERRRLSAGEIVFRQDAQADAGFVIASGTVVLVSQGRDRQKAVGSFGPGTLLGELALITETTRPASAKAETSCELLRITRPMFRRMLEEYPEYAAGLHERLKLQFAEMTRQILALEDRFSG
ncbi:MAG TPA: cyclic nucleotide-binding domain-containing protein [Aurantimonas sp.]|uniref:Cyclic nucleotide-binding domain-containing protein n=1 Tax=Aurantimonas marianensis TaxID=2920428 RepID=A0A9X2KFK7_9HYPH|nr:cyclic nucleotide-binding domain-containing protein [Aurantimonas marianensis]MCP3056573.1 cyclic nucleotide-binding domain-containing protein [Aurantimonas marianensis]